MTIKTDVLVIPGLILLLVGFLYEALDDYLVAGKPSLTLIEICVVCLIVMSLLVVVWFRIRRTRSNLYRQFVALTLFLMTFTAIHASLTAIMVKATGVWTVSSPPCYEESNCIDLKKHGMSPANLAMILSLPLHSDEMENWYEERNSMLCDWLANNRTFLWCCNSFLWAVAALPFWTVILLTRRHRQSLFTTNVQALPPTCEGAWPPAPKA